MTITSASSRDKKVFIDKFDPEAFRALARTAQAAGAAAARAGLPVTLVELVNPAAAARADLTDEQISAVLWVAISINAFNRVSIMSGHPVKEA
ncbi:hypothetical protein ABZ771_28930 [Streptomyces globisporus]|uniref:hypothetical protein n=1 Tax=Streptomyces globisporus TaxID=1908 RepID=UPI00345FEE42